MLAETLREKIQKEGPLPLYDYMALCLFHPQEGYYMHQAPIGPNGDFITAPEVSQMFGEMIGAYLLQYWIEHLKAVPVTFIECGPGKGTLTYDILRTFQIRPSLMQNLDIKLIEISPALQQAQSELLKNHTVQWYASIERALTSFDNTSIPSPILLVANEFLDALPIDQYTYRGNIWHKRHVNWTNDAFTFCWLPCKTPPLPWPTQDTIYEYSPDTPLIIEQIARHIKHQGGIALIIDYGYKTGSGDTLQGMQHHQYASVLQAPGFTDLTAHINFGWLKELVETQGCTATVITQGTFLTQLGIYLRAQQLSHTASEEMQSKIYHQVDYLTEKMGDLFKVLIVQNPA